MSSCSCKNITSSSSIITNTQIENNSDTKNSLTVSTSFNTSTNPSINSCCGCCCCPCLSNTTSNITSNTPSLQVSPNIPTSVPHLNSEENNFHHSTTSLNITSTTSSILGPFVLPTDNQKRTSLSSSAQTTTTTTSTTTATTNTGKMPSIQLSKNFSYVYFRGMRFLIIDCPTNETLPIYLKEFVDHKITDVVRVCQPSYNTESLEQNGIKVYDWHFQDGSVPTKEIIQKWLGLVEERFGPIHYTKKFNLDEETEKSVHHEPDSTIAIHCVAGLGRAPQLVAIALIESGMESLDAVTYIRKFRRGAFNSKQIAFLDTYKRGQYTKKTSKLANIILKKNRNSLTLSANSSNNNSSSHTNGSISTSSSGNLFSRGRNLSNRSSTITEASLNTTNLVSIQSNSTSPLPTSTTSSKFKNSHDLDSDPMNTNPTASNSDHHISNINSSSSSNGHHPSVTLNNNNNGNSRLNILSTLNKIFKSKNSSTTNTHHNNQSDHLDLSF